MFSKKHWRRAAVIVALVLALAVPASVGLAQGSRGNPGVLPPNSHPHGKTYAEWGASWWQWAMSIPYSKNPVVNDLTGAYCKEGQSGKVWFLAGTSVTGPVTRSCTIPVGKAVFFPIINIMNDYPCPPPLPPQPPFEPDPGQSLEDFLTNGSKIYPDIYPGVKWYMDPPQVPPADLDVEVDGDSLQNLSDYRATSRMFTFTGDSSLKDPWDSCVTGSPQKGVSDGYWIMLAPLSAGQHTIHFSAVGPWWKVNMTYNLTIKQ